MRAFMSSSSSFRRSIGIRHPVWSSYCPQILAGVVDFMREHEPWRLVTENNSYGEMESVKLDANWQGDGLILFRATEEELAAFRNRGQAVVLTSTEGPDLGYPRVIPDNAQIGRLAAEHLLEASVPHVAFLARGETFYREAEFVSGLRRYARERLGGFRQKLSEYAIEPIVHYLKGRPLWKEQTWREVQTEVMAFLDRLPKPCGLFVVDDSLGAVALRAADTLGIKVPEELAVIGFGDDPAYCYATYPALSSIAYPGREIGRKAAELLRSQMNGETLPQGRTEIPVQRVLARESSDTLAIADPELRELVRYIRLEAPRDSIRVSELSERSRLSMTTIKSRFTALFGHGPKQEIQRVRLRHMENLLADHTLSLAEIASRMKFSSSHELSRFYLTETGRRPSDFRDSISHTTTSEERRHQKEAVIFDMDGTLFDTEPVYYQAYRHAMEEQGFELSEKEYFNTFAGTTNASIETQLSQKFGRNFSMKAFRKSWHRHWQEQITAQTLHPFPGVVTLLELLCEEGIPVAIASSSDRADIELCLQSSGLAPYFPVKACGDEVQNGKPAPDIYQLACDRLGVDPAQCLAIEDTAHGVTSAAALAMKVVWVTTRPDDAPPGVYKVDLLEKIDRTAWKELLYR